MQTETRARCHGLQTPLGICGQPTGRVPRHVQFRHHANAPIRRVRDQIAQVFRRIGRGACEARIGRRAKSKTLIVRQMQMQHVQFVEPHRVQRALVRGNGKKSARRIHHQAAPRKTGRIAYFGNGETVSGTELRDGRERPERSPLGLRRDCDRVANTQAIAVVVREARRRAGWLPNVEVETQAPPRQAAHRPSDARRAAADDDVRRARCRARRPGAQLARARHQATRQWS